MSDINEIKNDNWNDIVGMVNEDKIVEGMLKKQDEWRA